MKGTSWLTNSQDIGNGKKQFSKFVIVDNHFEKKKKNQLEEEEWEDDKDRIKSKFEQVLDLKRAKSIPASEMIDVLGRNRFTKLIFSLEFESTLRKNSKKKPTSFTNSYQLYSNHINTKKISNESEVCSILIHKFHKLSEKIKIILESYDKRDYHSILFTLNFLNSSVSRRTFFGVLRKYNHLFEIYENYLKQFKEYDQLKDLYMYFGMEEEYTYVLLKEQLKKHKKRNKRFKSVDNKCIKDVEKFTEILNYAKKKELTYETQQLMNFIHLCTMECQVGKIVARNQKIKINKKVKKEGKKEDKLKDIEKLLYGKPISDYISFLMNNQNDENEILFSVKDNANQFKLKQKRFNFLKFISLTKKKKWEILENMIPSLNETGIPIDAFLDILEEEFEFEKKETNRRKIVRLKEGLIMTSKNKPYTKYLSWKYLKKK